MSVLQYVSRYHDISCGHRVVGHEGKCRFLHGHNYRIHFDATPIANLDEVGRVVDFSVLKSNLCMWLEEKWDHKFLLWENDPLNPWLFDKFNAGPDPCREILESFVLLPFNPTAENMAQYLLEVVAPEVMGGTGARVIQVRIDETRKCSAAAALD